MPSINRLSTYQAYLFKCSSGAAEGHYQAQRQNECVCFGFQTRLNRKMCWHPFLNYRNELEGWCVIQNSSHNKEQRVCNGFYQRGCVCTFLFFCINYNGYSCWHSTGVSRERETAVANRSFQRTEVLVLAEINRVAGPQWLKPKEKYEGRRKETQQTPENLGHSEWRVWKV